MKNKKYLTIILSIILTTTLLFIGCGKKEKTVTAITSEQFTTLYENTKTIYTETPELFAEDAEKPNLDLDSVTDSEIPMSEAMILKDAIQTLVNDNFSDELSKVTDDMLQNPEKGLDEAFYKAYVVAKQNNLLPSGVTDSNWDEAITKAEAIDLIIKAYEAIAKRDGYATNQQDGLNEGSVVGRGDQSEVNSGNDAQGTVEDADLVEGTALTQEELDTLKSQATTDAQKEALDAYETITKEGTWTDAYGVTYTEAVGKPDGSFKKMSAAEIEETLATANPKSDDYMIAQAEKEGYFVYYDTVAKKVYYDPYKLSEDSKPVIQESIERSQGEGELSAEEVKELLGEERYNELFGGN